MSITEDDIRTQIVAMNGFVNMAAVTESEHDCCSYLTMAFMHACIAATLIEKRRPNHFGFRMDDHKHKLRECILNAMLGVPLDKVLEDVKVFVI